MWLVCVVPSVLHFGFVLTPFFQYIYIKSLPAEVSLQIFSHLPFPTLLICALVSRRWKALANDQSLWKTLCQAQGWKWHRAPHHSHTFNTSRLNCDDDEVDDSDDEGMGDSDDDEEEQQDGNNHHSFDGVEAAKLELTRMHTELDSGFFSLSSLGPSNSVYGPSSSSEILDTARFKRQARHSAPSLLKIPHESSSFTTPDYKLLHQTHIKLRNRFMSSSYRLSALQTQGAPTNAHTNTIYCLQLYTYPETGKQVLFTGSRDKTLREWNLTTGMVERVISGVHNSSILSICVHNGYLASAGGDRQVAIWHLESNKLVKVLCEHDDSVLCVRFDDRRLVSCSKGKLIHYIYFFFLSTK